MLRLDGLRNIITQLGTRRSRNAGVHVTPRRYLQLAELDVLQQDPLAIAVALRFFSFFFSRGFGQPRSRRARARLMGPTPPPSMLCCSIRCVEFLRFIYLGFAMGQVE